jgi:hypothetical protein
MKILTFLAENWDSAVLIAGAVAALVVVIVKRRWDLLDKILFALVTEAERQFGDGTGQLKMAAVVTQVTPYIPSILRVFVTQERLEALVTKALDEAKLKWAANPKLTAGGG